ncbi:MAG: hypothetical protein EOO73_31785 [Myxococcales bacterium]|nr:MAG: hypothetical protein EOO73_31785 [Myxococcales bacterium]
MPPRPDRKRPPKPQKPSPAPSPFAPAAFLKGSPEAVRELCERLADIAHARFSDLTGTTWERTGTDLAQQLRGAGHDLTSFDAADDLQEWQTTYYHTRGTFSLLLAFRAPTSVEVTWRSDDGAISARRP